MPWKKCSVMDERLQFGVRRQAGEPLAELCREFRISRKTGYEDVNDAERVARDRTLGLISLEKVWKRGWR